MHLANRPAIIGKLEDALETVEVNIKLVRETRLQTVPGFGLKKGDPVRDGRLENGVAGTAEPVKDAGLEGGVVVKSHQSKPCASASRAWFCTISDIDTSPVQPLSASHRLPSGVTN